MSQDSDLAESIWSFDRLELIPSDRGFRARVLCSARSVAASPNDSVHSSSPYTDSTCTAIRWHPSHTILQLLPGGSLRWFASSLSRGERSRISPWILSDTADIRSGLTSSLLLSRSHTAPWRSGGGSSVRMGPLCLCQNVPQLGHSYIGAKVDEDRPTRYDRNANLADETLEPVFARGPEYFKRFQPPTPGGSVSTRSDSRRSSARQVGLFSYPSHPY